MRFKLTSTEREFLYQKYVSEGMDPVDAGKRIKKTRDYIDNIFCKLKEKGKTKEEINKRFKREFAKLREETDYRGKKRNKRRVATHKNV